MSQPQTPADMEPLEAARQAFRRGDLKVARRGLESILHADPANTQADDLLTKVMHKLSEQQLSSLLAQDKAKERQAKLQKAHDKMMQGGEEEVIVAPIKRGKPRRNYWIVGLGITALLCMLTVGGIGVMSYDRGNQMMLDYQRAPGCTSAADATSDLPPCSIKTMTVLKKEFGSHLHFDSDYTILMSPDGRSTYSVSFADNGLWTRTVAGTPVMAKVWMDKVTEVEVNGHRFYSEDYPQHELTRREIVFMAVGFVGLLVTWPFIHRYVYDSAQ